MSSLKVLVLSVALSVLVACGFQPPLVSGYPTDADRAAGATYLVEILVAGVPLGSGTAWVIRRTGDSVELMTAGHVCDTFGAAYDLLGRDSAHYPATVVSTSKDPDLCLLRAEPETPGMPLGLALAMPNYGDVVSYVGAPLGIWGDGMAPYYVGRYAGSNLVSIPGFGGASGSAVWTRQGVIGVLVSGYPRFPAMIHIVPLADIRAFLN
jgi:hypothetical protein